MIDYLVIPADDLPAEAVPVQVIETPALWSEADPETGAADLVTPATLKPGPWALIGSAAVDDALWADAVAEIDRETGVMLRCRDASLAGCTITPRFSGAPDVPLALPAPDPATYAAAITAHIEAAARSRQYDSAFSLASYTGSTVPGWAAEAQAFVAWRDAVWTYALAAMGEVAAAEREAPTVDGLIAELPTIEWPE